MVEHAQFLRLNAPKEGVNSDGNKRGKLVILESIIHLELRNSPKVRQRKIKR